MEGGSTHLENPSVALLGGGGRGLVFNKYTYFYNKYTYFYDKYTYFYNKLTFPRIECFLEEIFENGATRISGFWVCFPTENVIT